MFCSASLDGSVRLWNLSTFKPILRVFSTSQCTALWYGGDGVIISGECFFVSFGRMTKYLSNIMLFIMRL